MKTKRTVIILLVLAVAAVGIIAVSYIFQSSDSDVKGYKTDIEISSAELVQAFENDEQEANSRYLDKVVLVTGRVDAISVEEETVNVTLKKEEDIAGVICSFSKTSVDPEKILVGMEISIKGICSGYLLDVVLNKCVVEKY
ncbi:MAG: hypothetical protein JXB49_28420 [Bacteroidales bacterium]|nr:hypothetical protein [Bacteroidales bacterium]